ncbi:MAG: PKD domain-containing protein [Armatimonadota bacterium]|nr:MAG: PKD domain-containing protein [Armatimonadota bacterium]
MTVERDAELNPVRVVVQYEDGRTFEVDKSGHAARRLSATETAPVSEQEAAELRALYEAVVNWDTGWITIIPGVFEVRAYANAATPQMTAHLQGQITLTWDDDRACAGSALPVTCSYEGDPGASSVHIEGGFQGGVQLRFVGSYVYQPFGIDLGAFAEQAFTGYALGETVSASDNDPPSDPVGWTFSAWPAFEVSVGLAGAGNGWGRLSGSKIRGQIDSDYCDWTDEGQTATFCVQIPASASGIHQVGIPSEYFYDAATKMYVKLCIVGSIGVLCLPVVGCADTYSVGYCFDLPIIDQSLDLGFNRPVVTCDIPLAVDCPPACEISYYPPSTTTDDVITFSPGNCIVPASVDWAFGDGEVETGYPATHQYVMPGTYTVAAAMCHDDGRCGTCTAEITVGKGTNIPPECGDPAIAVEPAVVAINREATFTSNAHDPNPWGEILAYEWDFGDGGTGTGNPASHTYTVPGTYNVCVTLTDDQGGQTTCCAELTVLECVSDVAIDSTHCNMPAAGQIGQCKTGQIGAKNMSPTESCEVVLRVTDNAGNVVFESSETIAPGGRLRLRFDHCYTADEVGTDLWTWEVWPVRCGELTPSDNTWLRQVNVQPGVRSAAAN